MKTKFDMSQRKLFRDSYDGAILPPLSRTMVAGVSSIAFYPALQSGDTDTITTAQQGFSQI